MYRQAWFEAFGGGAHVQRASPCQSDLLTPCRTAVCPDIEEGPRASLSALPVASAEVNQYTEASTRLTKKRSFCEEVCETRNASARQ